MTHQPQSHETSPSPTAVLSYPQPDTTVCTVTGRMDAGTTPALSDTLAGAVRDRNPHLVLDLSAMTYLDPTVLNALFAVSHHHDISGGGHLAAVVDSTTGAIPSIYVVALKMVFDLHTDLAGALHSCITHSAPGGNHRKVGHLHSGLLTSRPAPIVLGSPESAPTRGARIDTKNTYYPRDLDE
ncbi:MAG: STAS domain-containing protein [Pseudonocardiaceae bacterium]